VKIRGYRIELGEIEVRLGEIEEVKEAVVVARDEGEVGKRLVAYYTGEEIGAEALRERLSATLPEYMVPAAYVYLEPLPLTANGKVDRRALPEPEGDAYVRREYEPPEGEIETALARIWADSLKIERVGRRENFFELGGHSLLAVSVVERMRQQGLYTNVPTFFVTPTVAALASVVTDVSDIVQVPSTKIPGLEKKIRI